MSFAARVTLAIRTGSREGLAEVYDRFSDSVVRDLQHFTGRDESFALDCLQETFMRLAARPPLCNNDAALAAWLRVTALRVARSQLVSESRRMRRERQQARPELVDDAGLAAEGAASLDVAETLTRLKVSLDQAEEELLRLRYIEGWSIRGIARWLAMEPSRVESRIRRLLARLRAGRTAR